MSKFIYISSWNILIAIREKTAIKKIYPFSINMNLYWNNFAILVPVPPLSHMVAIVRIIVIVRMVAIVKLLKEKKFFMYFGVVDLRVDLLSPKYSIQNNQK